MPKGKIQKDKRNSANKNPACLPKTSPLALQVLEALPAQWLKFNGRGILTVQR